MRTPKAHHAGSEGVVTGMSAPQAYRSPLHWTFFLEVVLAGYCLMASAFLVTNGDALWAVPLVFWAGCLALVAQLQMTPSPA